MNKQKLWNTYIMAGNLKIYLRKSMSAMEASDWLIKHCKIIGTSYYMCGTEVFCERR